MKSLLHRIMVYTLMLTCTLHDHHSFGQNATANKQLPGTLYWYFAGEVGYQHFPSGKFVPFKMKMGASSSMFDSYDISWNNAQILLAVKAKGTFNFDEKRFVVRANSDKIDYNTLSDGKNNTDVNYQWGNVRITNAMLSPDGKYIALAAQHFSDMPITIIQSATGKIVSSWSVKGISFLQYGRPVWSLDNTLYFQIADKVYKCAPSNSYKTAPLLAKLPNGCSSITINPQGTKMVYRYNRHLWLCNIDGSLAKQITTCKTSTVIDYDGENSPVFSPDGNYIAFTGATKSGTPWSDHNYGDGSWVATTGGRFGYIIIIAADGRLYDLDDKKGNAIWLKKPGRSTGVTANGQLIWR